MSVGRVVDTVKPKKIFFFNNKLYYVSSNNNAYTEKSLFARICPFSQSQSHISHVLNILFISSECPFHTLGVDAPTFQVYISINFFIGLQRS